ncbi:MAG: hypothetical protein ABSD11_20235, partial [Methylocella sp.]
HEGRKYRMLNIIDEFTHECLAIRIDRKLKQIKNFQLRTKHVHTAPRGMFRFGLPHAKKEVRHDPSKPFSR